MSLREDQSSGISNSWGENTPYKAGEKLQADLMSESQYASMNPVKKNALYFAFCLVELAFGASFLSIPYFSMDFYVWANLDTLDAQNIYGVFILALGSSLLGGVIFYFLSHVLSRKLIFVTATGIVGFVQILAAVFVYLNFPNKAWNDAFVGAGFLVFVGSTFINGLLHSISFAQILTSIGQMFPQQSLLYTSFMMLFLIAGLIWGTLQSAISYDFDGNYTLYVFLPAIPNLLASTTGFIFLPDRLSQKTPAAQIKNVVRDAFSLPIALALATTFFGFLALGLFLTGAPPYIFIQGFSYTPLQYIESGIFALILWGFLVCFAKRLGERATHGIFGLILPGIAFTIFWSLKYIFKGEIWSHEAARVTLDLIGPIFAFFGLVTLVPTTYLDIFRVISDKYQQEMSIENGTTFSILVSTAVHFGLAVGGAITFVYGVTIIEWKYIFEATAIISIVLGVVYLALLGRRFTQSA